MFTLGILTISTSGFHGVRSDDKSGEAIRRILPPPQYVEERYAVVPDDVAAIQAALRRWVDDDNLDLIVSTGGTGFSPTDVTPEACRAVFDKEAPGLAEAMRMQTLSKTPMAMISRSVAGLRKGTLIVALPGSPKAVAECLEVILPVLPHALAIAKDRARGHPNAA